MRQGESQARIIGETSQAAAAVAAPVAKCQRCRCHASPQRVSPLSRRCGLRPESLPVRISERSVKVVPVCDVSGVVSLCDRRPHPPIAPQRVYEGGRGLGLRLFGIEPEAGGA